MPIARVKGERENSYGTILPPASSAKIEELTSDHDRLLFDQGRNLFFSKQKLLPTDFQV